MLRVYAFSFILGTTLILAEFRTGANPTNTAVAGGHTQPATQRSSGRAQEDSTILGIAAGYPGDVGIEGHPAVIFADGFEDYGQASDLYQKWDHVFQIPQIRIANESSNVFAGGKSLEFNVPRQNNELSNAVAKILDQERATLFLRYYAKFQPPYEVIGSSHNGSMISAKFFVRGRATPGLRADGTNKFLVGLENWRGSAETVSPGLLNVYVYHPEQRSRWGDHFFPPGGVLPNAETPYDFGSAFVSRNDVITELDRWYAYELMVQANSPGRRNGRISAWLDGELVADFHNLRLRDTERLKIDRFELSFHIGSNPAAETKKWYDNVVAATSYIGPFVAP